MTEISSSTSFSNSLITLKMIAEEFKRFCAYDPRKSNMISLISVVLTKLWMPLIRMFFMPGIQSIGVSSVPSSLKLSSVTRGKKIVTRGKKIMSRKCCRTHANLCLNSHRQKWN
jgi:hypothetical protein